MKFCSDPESSHHLKFLKFLYNLIKNIIFLLLIYFILNFLHNLIFFLTIFIDTLYNKFIDI